MKNVPLYQKIFDHYYNKIITGQIKEGEQICTEKEIMEKFYVSRITAKRAVDMLAERGLVTRIPGRGTFVTMTPKVRHNFDDDKLIGIIFSDIEYSFGLDILKGIEDEARERNIHILFRRTFESLERENEAINSMVHRGVDGLIIQTVHGETYSDVILKLYLNGLPIVLVDRHMDKTKVPFVTTNNFKAAFDTTKYLIDLGYRNITFVSASPEYTSTLNDRYRGFKAAIKNDRTPDLLTLETPEIRERSEKMINRDINNIKQLLEENPKIDCIFAAEAYVAKLAHRAVKKLNLKVPDDIGIVCFDTDERELNGGTSFTHIEQQQYEMGVIAMKTIDEIIKGNADVKTDNLIDGIIIEGDTVIRKQKGDKDEKI
ncbi:MAG: substrate-binding domain-containing protein [Acholeplasmataceae bacterium]|nr:substrate-binding domain-containing protein [Acholeplasmataceae bacterium]